MNIGINLEVLFKGFKEFKIEKGRKFFLEDPVTMENSSIQKMFGCSLEEEHAFWSEYFIDAISKLEIRTEFFDVLDYSKHKYYLIVPMWCNNAADAFEEYKRNILKKLLQKRNLYFDKIVYEEEVMACAMNPIDAFIDSKEDCVNKLKDAIQTHVYENSKALFSFISNLKEEDKVLTGYASIDKPWLKYYPKAGQVVKTPHMSMYEYLHKMIGKNTASYALNYYGRRISVDELISNVELAARSFKGIGVKKGDIVTICTLNTPEVVYTMYALNKIGAVSNFIDPRTTPDGIKNYLNEADSKFVITLDKIYPLMKMGIDLYEKEFSNSISKVITISPFDSLPAPIRTIKNAEEHFNKNVKKNEYVQNRDIKWLDFMRIGKRIPFIENNEYTNKALIVHTGGTTGSPKGVVLSDDAMNGMVFQHLVGNLGFAPGQKFLNILVPWVAYGTSQGLHLPILLGNEVVLVPNFEPKMITSLLKKYNPENYLAIPSYIQPLLSDPEAKSLDFSKLNFVGLGGDGITSELLQAFNAFYKDHKSNVRVCLGYGMTEAEAGVTCNREKFYKLGTVGVPMPKALISIRDEQGKELKYGQDGEIYLAGDTMMSGYHNNQEETDEFFKTYDGIKWGHSGDIGMIDEDGFLHFKGRLKRLVIRSGFKVFTSEVEEVIQKHIAVATCTVVGVKDPDPEKVNAPIAVIVLKNEYVDQTNRVISEIELLCHEKLPSYKLPVLYFVRDKMPLTNIGKVDYVALTEEYQDESYQLLGGKNKKLEFKK